MAIEASSHALEQGRLDGLTVHTGVFSNLTRDHLDYHGDLETIAVPNSDYLMIFYLRVLFITRMMRLPTRHERRPQVQLLGILYRSKCRCLPEGSERNSSGLAFQIHSPFGTADIKTALHGRFNAFNVTAPLLP